MPVDREAMLTQTQLICMCRLREPAGDVLSGSDRHVEVRVGYARAAAELSYMCAGPRELCHDIFRKQLGLGKPHVTCRLQVSSGRVEVPVGTPASLCLGKGIERDPQ